ncbi:hypothetical protein NPIL_362861 [Nephila pilipes]|uniref:Uncharacterized protein n=1 Tax=Nephila pilipes TaxID=299642 RepID=A0A8X6TTU0_NEPPI|nr:hypothetical protein NPIL_362861 [Nephila pilipes]
MQFKTAGRQQQFILQNIIERRNETFGTRIEDMCQNKLQNKQTIELLERGGRAVERGRVLCWSLSPLWTWQLPSMNDGPSSFSKDDWITPTITALISIHALFKGFSAFKEIITFYSESFDRFRQTICWMGKRGLPVYSVRLVSSRGGWCNTMLSVLLQCASSNR